MKRLLLSPGESDGGSPTDPPPSAPPPSPSPTENTPPPAAKTVLTGTKTERETQLEDELTKTRGELASTAQQKKDREIRINQLEDELRTLKKIPGSKKEKSAPWTFFDEDDDES